MPRQQPRVIYLSQRSVRANRHDVLQRVIREHEPALRRFLRVRLANHPDYEDLVQETFLRLAKQENVEEKLSRGEAQTRSYLFSIATNLVRDRHRHRIVRKEVKLSLVAEQRSAHHEPSPEDVYISRQSIAAVRRAILKLPPKCRRAFVLSRFRDLSYRQIADRMNISISMVEKHIMRALAEMRAAIEL